MPQDARIATDMHYHAHLSFQMCGHGTSVRVQTSPLPPLPDALWFLARESTAYRAGYSRSYLVIPLGAPPANAVGVAAGAAAVPPAAEPADENGGVRRHHEDRVLMCFEYCRRTLIEAYCNNH